MNDHMSDEEFINQFETCTFPAASFHHREHAKVVWLYLQRYSVLETLARFSDNLKRFAAANGKANLYHETITWAFLFLIRERMVRYSQQHGTQLAWDEFTRHNPDLLSWKDNLLKRYYLDETLSSELAKRAFIFPDRLASQSHDS